MTFSLRSLLTTAACLGMLSFAPSAEAYNEDVDNTLAKRPELSQFHAALKSTGVLNELIPGVNYTILAPTNAAFAKLDQDQYPCLYSAACAEDIAKVLRNHIVPGERHMVDITTQNGGIFSIDDTFVSVGEPTKGRYTLSGRNVLSQSQTSAGILYEIDGVIASQQELADLKDLPYVVVPVATQTRTTTTKTYEPVSRLAPTIAPAAGEVTTTTTVEETTRPGAAVIVPKR